MEEFIQECSECKVSEHLKSKLCPVCMTQKLVRGKWKIVIIFLLKDGALRFSQIKKSIPKVTQAYLSSQLKEMENTGLIIRRSYNQVPPKVEYYLTDQGKDFIKVIDSMHLWGVDYIDANLKN
ncbi:helix-turn-helix domain-containing protein [uncultured Ilyobacter sp.]|uniref:winged helix-turn-helix transcriptional regulator n=1 Tax=uncultured Ilyobacter sp. TaxID=544433 RepID=UPI0029F47AA2|nr:helix-turn-helix domain-containing protein [uncultured Ilyobacter sp.]